MTRSCRCGAKYSENTAINPCWMCRDEDEPMPPPAAARMCRCSTCTMERERDEARAEFNRRHRVVRYEARS